MGKTKRGGSGRQKGEKRGVQAGPVSQSRGPGLYWIFLLLIMLPLLAYWQATSFELVWDDKAIHLTENPYLNGASNVDLLHLWKGAYKGAYNPLTYMFWASLRPVGQVFSSVGGPFNPFVYHLANIFIHIINGFLVFFLLRLILKDKWPALFGALLFLLHPIQVESVAWVSGCRGLLSTCLGLSALHLYLAGARRETSSAKGFVLYYAGGFILFSLAILSKTSAVVIPVFACLLDIFLFKRSIKRVIIRTMPWLIAIIPIFIITSTAQSSDIEAICTPLWIRPFIWMDAVGFYISKVLYPLSLTVSYGRTPDALMSGWWLYIGWLVPLAIGYLLWRLRDSFPPLGLSFIMFLVGFLPFSGLIHFLFYQEWSTVADRYIYLAMPGISLAFAYGLTRLRKNASLAVAAGLIIFWGGLSYARQIPVWKDSFTLWDHCVRVTPAEAKAYYNRGVALGQMGQYGRAMNDYNRAIEINPGYSAAYDNRGYLLEGRKEYDKALRDYDKAIETDPRFPNALNNRANLLKKMGEYDKALGDYNRAIEITPRFSRAFFNRGNLYMAAGEYGKALKDYDRAIEIDPEKVDAFINRGSLYRDSGDHKKAVSDYNRALKIDPGRADAYINRGIVFKDMKKYGKAINDLGRAIKIDPLRPEPYGSRGTVFAELGEYHRAIDDYNKAIDIDSRYLDAYLNRGNAFGRLKEYTRAIGDYTEAIKIKPRSAKLFMLRAAIYTKIKDYRKAISDYDRAIEINPRDGVLFNNRGAAFYYLKEYDRSWDDVLQAERLGLKVPPAFLKALREETGRD